MRRLISIGLLAMVVVATLTGCGQTPTPSPSATPIPPTATPVPPTPTPAPPTAAPTPTIEQTLAGKRVLFLIQSGFNDGEYSAPRILLEQRGATIVVAAKTTSAKASYGGSLIVEPDILLEDAHAADYDAVVFVGGMPYNANSPEMLRIAREAADAGILIAGICGAVRTLALADILEGKEVTRLLNGSNTVLEEAGAVLVFSPVAQDGLLITGSGPGASVDFAEAIVAALEGSG